MSPFDPPETPDSPGSASGHGEGEGPAALRRRLRETRRRIARLRERLPAGGEEPGVSGGEEPGVSGGEEPGGGRGQSGGSGSETGAARGHAPEPGGARRRDARKGPRPSRAFVDAPLSSAAATAPEAARPRARAVAALEARDRASAALSHDLRNALGVVRGYVEHLFGEEGSATDPKRNRYLEPILGAIARMEHLIDELSRLPRLETDQVQLHRRPCSAGRLLRDAADLYRPLAEDEGIELRVEEMPDELAVEADRERLLQVLSNLIGNAIKFCERGGWASMGAEPAGDQVRFCVADDGPGIPDSDLDRIYDPAWRGSEAGAGGSGLGLTIAKRIVEAHGGRIWVDTRVGVGTSFYFTIPALPRRAGPPAAARSPT